MLTHCREVFKKNSNTSLLDAREQALVITLAVYAKSGT
jgi:hypothetical protein